MKVIRSFIAAFSLYSRIPMPKISMEKEDRKYALCFFPFVGAVIGGLMSAWYWLSISISLNEWCRVLMLAAIPIIITGGFHLDGFMDTMDALHSYQERERKLEILKDPHIGAFSVIMMLLYYLVYLSLLFELQGMEHILIFGAGFILSRALSGLTLLYFPSARLDGMLHTEKTESAGTISTVCLIFQGILSLGIIGYISMISALLVFAGVLLLVFYYRHICMKEFGGVTGDTAGYFVTMCELLILFCITCGSRLPVW